jgi:glycosyltransferase involved in cell wall biosynthesis
MRVGLFTECYRPIRNGVVASVDALAHAIRARGHEAICVTPSMPGYRTSHENVVRIPSLPLPTRTAYRLTIPLLPIELVAPSLAHLSIVHTHSPFVTGWMGLRLAKRLHVPLVFTYHTQLEEYAHYFPFETRLTRSAAARLTRKYASAAEITIVPTAAMESHLRDLGVTTRIEVVPSGIELALFAAGRRDEALRARLGVGAGLRMVLAAGRLAREKNLELSLEAFARLADPSARLVLVGDGLHRRSLERTALRLGIARRTTFAGEFAREALPDIYASADALLFTSSSETQGLVLVEALAAGAPVVAVDTPQTRDVLGGSGTIVPPDAAAIAAALRRVLEGGTHALPAAALASRRFDSLELGNRILDLYGQLLDRPSLVTAV